MANVVEMVKGEVAAQVRELLIGLVKQFKHCPKRNVKALKGFYPRNDVIR